MNPLLLLAVQLFAAPPDGRIASAELPPTANRHYQLLRTAAPTAGDKLPLVVYLHGAGAKGDDNRKPMGEVPPKLLARPAVGDRFPCFVLLPQCRDGVDDQKRPNNWVKWQGQATNPPAKWERAEKQPSDQLRGARLALSEVLANHLEIDRDRVYLVGVSMGGSGACYWAALEPGRFAAVLACCGLSEVAKAPQLAKVPLHLFHGTDDPVAPFARSRQLAEAVKAAGGDVRLTEYAGAGHGISERAFTENDYAAFRWLFAQKRGESK